MAEIKVAAEYFVKPKHEVEAAKQPYHLPLGEVAMLSIHPIQKGLLFPINNNPNNYSSNTQFISNFINNLKHSLSVALIHFYPLAGLFVTQKYPDENASSVHIDCTKGPGARLIHASALDAAVSDITATDKDDVPASLVHSLFELGEKSVNFDGHTRALLSIQVTQLKDGLFIGFTINHSVVDGTSFIHFVSMLSENFNSQQESISRAPVFNYRPWVDPDQGITEVLKLTHLEPEQLIKRVLDPGPLRERIFHFSREAMSALKARANKECGTNNNNNNNNNNVISSFQALCAFVWRSITRARNLSSDQSTSCSLLMNVRSRLDPPVSDDYFGNLIGGANGNCNVGELLSHDLGWSAMILHKDIMAQDGNKILDLFKLFAKSPMVIRPDDPDFHGPNKVTVGGSPRFGMYGPEFGLGRAVAARMGFGNKEDGKVTANPGCEGLGTVDLEICLRPLSMEALEHDSEFMSLVSCK